MANFAYQVTGAFQGNGQFAFQGSVDAIATSVGGGASGAKRYRQPPWWGDEKKKKLLKKVEAVQLQIEKKRE